MENAGLYYYCESAGLEEHFRTLYIYIQQQWSAIFNGERVKKKTIIIMLRKITR